MALSRIQSLAEAMCAAVSHEVTCEAQRAKEDAAPAAPEATTLEA